MSDTDSLTDYESADEDSESSSPNNPVKSVTKENVTGDGVQEDLGEDKAGKSNVNSKEELHSEIQVAEELSSQTKQEKIKNELNDNVKQIILSEESNVNDGEPSGDKQISENQSKRVTLRLEKKLQQKNRPSSVESAKIEESKTPEKPVSSWGLSSWGTSLLSSAAASVSTFTTHVSQGIGTVLETVETTLGAPAPEDLAAILKERSAVDNLGSEETINAIEDEKKGEQVCSENDPASKPSSIFTGVTSLTKAIESTGSKVIMGGLDTLELIGKKTIDILTEGDPGLRKKRSVLSSGMTLSQILREAKEMVEEEQLSSDDENVHFSTVFDEVNGFVHLEALELLSGECQNRVQRTLMVSASSEEKSVLEQVLRICDDLPPADAPDEENMNYESSIKAHVELLQLPFNICRIENIFSSADAWLQTNVNSENAGELKNLKLVHNHAIGTLANLTAACIEQFHKFGEHLVAPKGAEFDALKSATSLTKLAGGLCLLVNDVSCKYCKFLNDNASNSEDPASAPEWITNVFAEAMNSTTYIQDAFKLLIPVLQASLLE